MTRQNKLCYEVNIHKRVINGEHYLDIYLFIYILLTVYGFFFSYRHFANLKLHFNKIDYKLIFDYITFFTIN